MNSSPLVLSPEQLAAIEADRAREDARVASYWQGTPANASVPGAQPDLGAQAFGGPPPPAAPPSPPPGAFDVPRPAPPAFQAQLDAAFGSPRTAPKVDPVTRAPEWDPSAINPKTIQFAPPGQPASAAAPLGPTPADDAAFAAKMAQVSTAPKPPAAGPARAAGKPNPDPYGIKAAQQGLLGTYGAREDAQRRLMSAEADKAAMLGDHHAELARRRSEDAQFAQMEEQIASEHFESRMTELERQMDDVASKKIDPKRLMKETPGLGFLAVIGGAIGGFYQGLTRSGENPFLKELNLMIDRDISAQEREMDQANRGIGQKAGLLNQQRQLFQDTQQAKLAARALYYQSAQDEIQAEAARYDSPIYQARADDAVAQIEGEKQKVMLEFAQANQRASMAAAGQMLARDREVQALYRDVYDKVLQNTNNPALAEQEARRQVAVVYQPHLAGPRTAAVASDPISMVPKPQQEKALEERERYLGAQRGKKAVEDLFRKYEEAPDLPTWTGDAKRDAVVSGARLNLRVALGKGFSSDKDTETYIDKNLPKYGESAEARRQKLENIQTFLDTQAATPILDTHAPGWRPKDIARKDVK